MNHRRLRLHLSTLTLAVLAPGLLACPPPVSDDDGFSDEGTEGSSPSPDGSDSKGEGADEGGSTGGGDDGDSGVGNLPCSGCAGDPCEVHDDCIEGFICTRVDSETAFCTNCAATAFDPLLTDDCVSECAADVNCGEGGVCEDGVCLHGCSNDLDCPTGHTCRSSGACVPDGLPELGEECIVEEAFLCALDGPTQYACIGIFEGGMAIDSWCSRPCSEDIECTDVWVAGCCATIEDGSHWCVPYEYSGACGGGGPSEPICEDTCQYADDGECDDGGPGSQYSVCDYGTDCTDCGPRE